MGRGEVYLWGGGGAGPFYLGGGSTCGVGEVLPWGGGWTCIGMDGTDGPHRSLAQVHYRSRLTIHDLFKVDC